jgi:hypothetical protein
MPHSVHQPDPAFVQLGRYLADFRREAGHSQQTLAPLAGYGRSTLANVETGRHKLPRAFWQSCDTLLDAGGQLVDAFDAIAAAPSEPPRSTVSEVRPHVVDPALVTHWAGMLEVLTTSLNTFGPRHLHDVARGELAVIRHHRQASHGHTRTGLLQVEARWAEFTSWTADNLGDTYNAGYWLLEALSLAREAQDRSLSAYVIMRQAQRAADDRDPARAVALAQSAMRQSSATARDRALCAIRYAQGSALAGDVKACGDALRQAHRLVAAAADGQDADTIGRHCIPAYVTAHEGYCLLVLGQPRKAADVLEDVLLKWPAPYRQDEGLARTWLAYAYAGDRRVEQAVDQADQALSLAVQAGSARMAHALARVDAQLAPHATVPGVRQFRTRYADIRTVTGKMSR